MYGHVWSFVLMYGHVWLCQVMYGNVGSCKVIWSSMVLCGKVYLCMGMSGHACLYMVMFNVCLCLILYGRPMRDVVPKKIMENSIKVGGWGQDWTEFPLCF